MKHVLGSDSTRYSLAIESSSCPPPVWSSSDSSILPPSNLPSSGSFFLSYAFYDTVFPSSLLPASKLLEISPIFTCGKGFIFTVSFIFFINIFCSTPPSMQSLTCVYRYYCLEIFYRLVVRILFSQMPIHLVLYITKPAFILFNHYAPSTNCSLFFLVTVVYCKNQIPMPLLTATTLLSRFCFRNTKYYVNS